MPLATSSVHVLSGPNLNRLGTREPDVYGSETLDDVHERLTAVGERLGQELVLRQTNDEAQLIGWLHEAVDARADVVLNPAAFTHFSYAVRDACAMVTGAGLRLVEVHLSNPMARESFRHTSVIGAVATGTIAGFGARSYELALEALAGQ